MSIMRCDRCERDVDTDFEEMLEEDWDLGIYYCEPCHMEKEDEESVARLLRMPAHPHDPL